MTKKVISIIMIILFLILNTNFISATFVEEGAFTQYNYEMTRRIPAEGILKYIPETLRVNIMNYPIIYAIQFGITCIILIFAIWTIIKYKEYTEGIGIIILFTLIIIFFRSQFFYINVFRLDLNTIILAKGVITILIEFIGIYLLRKITLKTKDIEETRRLELRIFILIILAIIAVFMINILRLSKDKMEVIVSGWSKDNNKSYITRNNIRIKENEIITMKAFSNNSNFEIKILKIEEDGIILQYLINKNIFINNKYDRRIVERLEQKLLYNQYYELNSNYSIDIGKEESNKQLSNKITQEENIHIKVVK